MLDELLSKINEVVQEEKEGKDQESSGGTHISVGDIVNNQGTVVIGGNANQGRREEDKPGAGDGSHGRRASDRDLREELHQLRHQVQALKAMVMELYIKGGLKMFKRPVTESARSHTDGQNSAFSARRSDVSQIKPPPTSTPTRDPSPARKPRRIRIPVPLFLSRCHQIPLPSGFPYSVSPNTLDKGWESVAASPGQRA